MLMCVINGLLNKYDGKMLFLKYWEEIIRILLLQGPFSSEQIGLPRRAIILSHHQTTTIIIIIRGVTAAAI